MWWTFAAALMASATALLIAFFAYPWQKQKDRELQTLSEKRRAYARFFDASNDFYRAMQSRKEVEIEDASHKLRQHLNEMYLYATPEVLREVHGVSMCMLFWRVTIRGDYINPKTVDEQEKDFERLASSFMDHELTAIKLARSEILGETFDEADEVVSLWEDGRYLRFRDSEE